MSVQGRTPLDLLSKGLKGYLTAGTSTEVYSWGNGANYQLGSGAEGLQLVPSRVENLHGENTAAVAAAKFHSAAVSKEGILFTWGFGRGGRLGESTLNCTPWCLRPLPRGLLCMLLLSPAKHMLMALHTWALCHARSGLAGGNLQYFRLLLMVRVYVIVLYADSELSDMGRPPRIPHPQRRERGHTSKSGRNRRQEADRCSGHRQAPHRGHHPRRGALHLGSNRDGRLGYPAVDTQPIPRRWRPSL